MSGDANEDDDIPRRRPFVGRVGAGAKRRLQSLSFNRILPNILTLLAMCAGLTAIRYGIAGQWERAVLAIVVAAMLDGVDGRLARLLRSTSDFGAQLDSLADAVSFGVAPALLMFLWVMHDAGGVGWALSLLHAVCAVLRLARFNTMVGEPDLPHWAHNYFTGVPSPAGAGIAIMPLIFWLYTDSEFFASPIVAGAFLLTSSILMVSRVPVFAGKHLRLKPQHALMLMVGVIAVVGFLVTDPWPTLSILGILYLASIPLSVVSFRRLQAHAAATATDTPPNPL